MPGARQVCRGAAWSTAFAAASLLALIGCSSSSPAPAATSPTSSAAITATGRTIAIQVTGSSVTPPPAQVDLGVGQTLTLVVTSDHDDELHAHGFEVETTLKAGQPSTITLTGNDSGAFEVETHHPPLTLLTVAVR